MAIPPSGPNSYPYYCPYLDDVQKNASYQEKLVEALASVELPDVAYHVEIPHLIVILLLDLYAYVEKQGQLGIVGKQAFVTIMEDLRKDPSSQKFTEFFDFISENCLPYHMDVKAFNSYAEVIILLLNHPSITLAQLLAICVHYDLKDHDQYLLDHFKILTDSIFKSLYKDIFEVIRIFLEFSEILKSLDEYKSITQELAQPFGNLMMLLNKLTCNEKNLDDLFKNPLLKNDIKKFFDDVDRQTIEFKSTLKDIRSIIEQVYCFFHFVSCLQDDQKKTSTKVFLSKKNDELSPLEIIENSRERVEALKVRLDNLAKILKIFPKKKFSSLKIDAQLLLPLNKSYEHLSSILYTFSKGCNELEYFKNFLRNHFGMRLS